MPLRQKNIVAALILIAIGLVYAYLTSNLPDRRAMANMPGADFFPNVVLVVFMVLAVSLLIQGLSMPREQAAANDDALPAGGVIAKTLVLFIVFTAVLPFLGFLLAGIPFIFTLMWMYGERRALRLAAGSILIPTFFFYLFREVFQILLPQGPLPALFG